MFISYRRGTSTPYAGRLRDALADRFGDGHVFMDMDSILPGTEWDEAIRESVRRCGVLLAIIGRGWTNVHDAQNRRRLEDPGDFVRLEIESALASGVPVIPILLHGTRMPRPEQLPGQLRELARRQAMTARDETWRSDVTRLLDAIEQLRVTRGPKLEETAEPPSPAAARDVEVEVEVAKPERAPELVADPEPVARGGSEERYLTDVRRRMTEAGYESVDPSGCAGASLIALKRIGVGEQTFGFAARAIREKSAKRLLGAYTGDHLELAVIAREFASLSGLELAGFMQQAEDCTSSLLHRKGTRMKGAYFAIAVAITRRPSPDVIGTATAKPTLETKGATVLPVIVDLDTGQLHYFRERTLRWVLLSAVQHIPEELLSPSG